jgi:hypothetical protein
MRVFKKIAELLPYPLLMKLFCLKYSATTGRREQAVADALHMRPARIQALLDLKQSDTLVFLGGGPSINLIPDSFWEAIRKYDTVGVNFWLFHPFVPRLYFLEAISRIEPSLDPYDIHGLRRSAMAPDPYDMFRIYREVASERENDYLKVPKFITALGDFRGQPVSPLPVSWQDTTSYLRVEPVPARSVKELKRGLSHLIKRGTFKPFDTPCFKQASSLSLLVGLAVKMGYKRILLCGVDLTNSRYFHQDHKLYPKWHNVMFLSPGSYPAATPMKWRVPIQDVIMSMKELLLDPAGIQIFVQSRESALYPGVQEMPSDFFR